MHMSHLPVVLIRRGWTPEWWPDNPRRGIGAMSWIQGLPDMLYQYIIDIACGPSSRPI